MVISYILLFILDLSQKAKKRSHILWEMEKGNGNYFYGFWDLNKKYHKEGGNWMN